MIECKYNKKGSCELINLIIGKTRYISNEACIQECWPNHAPAQIEMLKKHFKIEIKNYEGYDLLEWLKKQIE